MREHIERLRAKPEHERRRVALAASTAATGVVAVAWFLAMVAGGAFNLETGQGEPTLADTTNSLTASVASGTFFAPESPTPDVTVVDGNAQTTFDAAPVVEDRTVIPF